MPSHVTCSRMASAGPAQEARALQRLCYPPLTSPTGGRGEKREGRGGLRCDFLEGYSAAASSLHSRHLSWPHPRQDSIPPTPPSGCPTVLFYPYKLPTGGTAKISA